MKIERRVTTIYLTKEQLELIPQETSKRHILIVNDPQGKKEDITVSTGAKDIVLRILKLLGKAIEIHYNWREEVSSPSYIQPDKGWLASYSTPPKISIETYGDSENSEMNHQQECQDVLDWLEKHKIFVEGDKCKCSMHYSNGEC